MNRKQRRQKGVQYVSPIIKKFKAEDIIATTMYVPMLVMRNRGYGSKRLGDFLEDILDQLKMVEEDRVSIKDMAKAIEAETGIKFEGKL